MGCKWIKYEPNRQELDSAYLQLKLSVQKNAKNRAEVEKDTERKKEKRQTGN